MRYAAYLLGALGLLVAGSGSVVADPEDNDLIDKIILSYGGEKLTALNSLILEDRYKSISTDGGRRPGEAVVSKLHSNLAVDFETGRKAVKNWTVNKNGNRLGKIMFDGEQGWSVNFLRGSYVARDDLTGSNVGSGMMRLLDTTVVHELHRQRANAMFEGTEDYNGQLHAVVLVKPDGAATYKLFVDAETYKLSKMERGRASYFYHDHKVESGIGYAASTDYLVGGQPRLLTVARTIRVNPNVEEAFVIPEGAKKLPGMMDNSEMSVTKLSDNSYMVGKGFAFSLFVDAGDHFVAVGGLSGTKARLEALNAELGADKPLRYVVLPEHHRSHLSGVNEMADMGVTFVVHKSHVDALKEKLSKPLAFERILAVDAHHELASGRAKVFDISTIQSAHYLLTYVPEAHLVFVVDEFGTNLVDSVPSADKRMISFRKALEGLKIDVSRIVHIHGRQPLTTTQLVEVTDGYMDQPCPEGESICADE